MGRARCEKGSREGRGIFELCLSAIARSAVTRGGLGPREGGLPIARAGWQGSAAAQEQSARRHHGAQADRRRRLELGRAVRLRREAIRADQGRQPDLGGAQGRTAHRLLPHREAAQSRAAAADRLHGVVLPGEDRARLGGMDAGGRDPGWLGVWFRRHTGTRAGSIIPAGCCGGATA